MPYFEISMDYDLAVGQSVGNWVMRFMPNVFGDEKDNLDLRFLAFSDEGQENCIIEEELMIDRKTALYLRNYINAFLEDCEETRKRNE